MTSRQRQSITKHDFRLLPGESVHDFYLACKQFYGVPVHIKWRGGVPVIGTCMFVDDANRIAFGEIRQLVTPLSDR